MALELYRPFVIARLVQNNYAANVKGARRLIERNRPEVWEALEGVIGDRPVLLNRAPTLAPPGYSGVRADPHRRLCHSACIRSSPPLSTRTLTAIRWLSTFRFHRRQLPEARELMLASKNLLKPADGEPIISPSKDMVLGVYYLTMEKKAVIVVMDVPSQTLMKWNSLTHSIKWMFTPRSNSLRRPGTTIRAPPARSRDPRYQHDSWPCALQPRSARTSSVRQ
jgi:hypothetical protein